MDFQAYKHPREGSSTAYGAVDDQRENDRHEREMNRIAALPVNERQAAIDAELQEHANYAKVLTCTLGEDVLFTLSNKMSYSNQHCRNCSTFATFATRDPNAPHSKCGV
jgi:hypothetical protein